MRNSEERSYRDIKNSLDTAKAEGRAEGRSETLVEVAKNLLSIGTPIDSIMKATGMTEEEIKCLI
ncbi:MAG: hypothetical protein ACLUNW_09765 [Prevotella sp.]